MRTPSIDPKRGEIWFINLDPTQGAEIQKRRPCVVLSANGVGRLPLPLVVPLTGWNDASAGNFWQVQVEPLPKTGLTKDSAADTLQTRSVDLSRFAASATGRLSDEVIADIAEALAFIIDYDT